MGFSNLEIKKSCELIWYLIGQFLHDFNPLTQVFIVKHLPLFACFMYLLVLKKTLSNILDCIMKQFNNSIVHL